LTSLHKLYLEFAGFFEIVNIIDSTCCARADHEDAVVVLGENTLRFITLFKEAAGNPGSLLEAVSKTAKVAIIDYGFVESAAVLVNHLELVVLGASQEGPIVLMSVKHGFSSFSAKLFVHWPMESDGSNIRSMRLVSELVDSSGWSENLSAKGTQREIFRLDGAPQNAIRQSQKRILIIKGETQMCITTFVEALLIKRSIAESKLLSQMLFFVAHGQLLGLRLW
jgi:hypothetical protein